jgi:hypothetical protein
VYCCYCIIKWRENHFKQDYGKDELSIKKSSWKAFTMNERAMIHLRMEEKPKKLGTNGKPDDGSKALGWIESIRRN